jgi:hypothetical protein
MRGGRTRRAASQSALLLAKQRPRAVFNCPLLRQAPPESDAQIYAATEAESLEHNCSALSVTIARSTVTGAGRGLFALRDFKQGDVVVHLWGKIMDESSWMVLLNRKVDETHRGGTHEEDFARPVCMGSLRCIHTAAIAGSTMDRMIASSHCPGAYINEHIDVSKRNVAFPSEPLTEDESFFATADAFRWITLTATRTITQGEELFTHYGWDKRIWEIVQRRSGRTADIQWHSHRSCAAEWPAGGAPSHHPMWDHPPAANGQLDALDIDKRSSLVELRISKLHSTLNQPVQFGLFAKQAHKLSTLGEPPCVAIKEGEEVCAYGGLVQHESLFRKHGWPRTHARVLPGGIIVLDGRPLAAMIQRPVATDQNGLDLLLQAGMQSLLPSTKSFPKWMVDRFQSSGFGFMANTSTTRSADRNVRISFRSVTIAGIIYDVPVLTATRDILVDEEILSPYNTPEASQRSAAALAQPFYAHEMEDSTSLLKQQDWDGLGRRLQEQGFLLLRGVLEEDDVQQARTKMLEHLHSLKVLEVSAACSLERARLAKTTRSGTARNSWTIDAETGQAPQGSTSAQIDAWQAVGLSPQLTNIYRAPALFHLYAKLFGRGQFKALSHCTWLRAKGRHDATAEHADFYHFALDTPLLRNYYSPSSFQNSTSASDSRHGTAMVRDTSVVMR